jgi:dTDP-4-dehydrorhamnose reductase
MRVVITGAAGQLGRAFRQAFAPEHEVIALGHAELDLSHPECVEQLVATGADLVLHPAAFTNVDGCAREPERAYRANGLGTRYVALACRRLDAALVYVSTNEVFDGAARTPYYEYDRPNPINPYGWSKWVGEEAVRELVARHYIVRVAWLFGGERNFVRTVLRLAAERDTLSMVTDEVGSPTYAPDVAAATLSLVRRPFYGTYHLVNQGACSRYDFAAAALRLAGSERVALRPMALADYKRDSVVPPYTPLRNIAAADLGVTLRPWEEALAEYVASLRSADGS